MPVCCVKFTLVWSVKFTQQPRGSQIKLRLQSFRCQGVKVVQLRQLKVITLSELKNWQSKYPKVEKTCSAANLTWHATSKILWRTIQTTKLPSSILPCETEVIFSFCLVSQGISLLAKRVSFFSIPVWSVKFTQQPKRRQMKNASPVVTKPRFFVSVQSVRVFNKLTQLQIKV